MTTHAEVYARIPSTGCKGHCRKTCTVLGLTPVEAERLKGRVHDISATAQAGGPSLEKLLDSFGDKIPTCPSLTAFGTCGIYDERPYLCRAYGAVEDMPCQWGCVPPGGRIPSAEGRKMLHDLMEATE